MQDNKERKYPASLAEPIGRLNADDGEDFVGANEYVNAECFRSGSTDKGVTGLSESIGSTVLLSTPLPSLTFDTIGAAEEAPRNRFCYFKRCVTGPWDKIVCYDDSPGVQREFDVLLASQVTGGFNFSNRSPIHSAAIEDGKLYWVDSTNNPPRKINIDAAIKANNPSYNTDEVAYTFPINFDEITVIKRPCILPPSIQKLNDSSFQNNFIYNISVEFAYQYLWYDKERTVSGVYSKSSRLNNVTDNSNYIQVQMDSTEQIPQTVRIVNLWVRFSNSNNAFIVRSWDKNIAADLADIQNQNNGVIRLTYNFYGNIYGEAISNGLDEAGNSTGSPNLVMKAFDSVPIFSETMSIFGNRLGLGNNTEGYDAPKTTSLSLSAITTNTNNVNLRKQLIKVYISFNGSPQHGYAAWYVFLTEVSKVGYYELTTTVLTNTSTTPPTIGVAPGFVAFGSMNFRGLTQNDVSNYVKTSLGANGAQVYNSFTPLTDPIAGYTNITGVSNTVYQFFKSRDQYQFGVEFLDFAGRRCGVVTNKSLFITTPTRNFNLTSGVSGIAWTLSNNNAINEIPDTAYYYAPLRTLTLKTRFFIDSFTNAAKYATKDVNGNYLFTSNLYTQAAVGIGLNTSALIQSGLGYEFDPGSNDVCVLIRDDDTVYELPVIAQVGAYIVIKAQDIGDLTNRRFVFEVYTPYFQSTQEPFHETGNMYRVLNPGTSGRLYSTLSDIFLPDAYALTRTFDVNSYMAEAMSPNDLFYKPWYNDGGKVNIVTQLGQQVKESSIRYSNNFIPDTDINGLSTFDFLDERSLPLGCGAITKLQLTSKVQNELGVILAALCQNEFVSIYVGEVQQFGSTRPTALVTSTEIIGTMNILKGSYGCTDATAVWEYRGNIYYLSASSGKIIQYSVNGLFPISNYKMTRFWGQWCKQYLSMSKDRIESLGDKPYPYMTVDPYHGELLISLPKLMNIPPKGYLPDFTYQSPKTVTAYNVRQTYTLGGVLSFYYSLCVYIDSVLPVGYYLVPFTETYSSSPIPDSFPNPSYDFSQLQYRGSTLSDVLYNTRPDGAILTSSSLAALTTTIVNNIPTRTIYPFDILDFQGKTIVYELDKGTGFPKWKGSYPFVTETFVTLLNNLYSFKTGLLYIHNQTSSYNQFYGTRYKSRIMLVFNQGAPIPKTFDNIGIKCNLVPSLVYAYADVPYQQCTDLVDFDFTNYEGLQYATFYRNKLIPTATGYSISGLLVGDKVRTAALFVLIEFSVNQIPAQLEFISVGSTQSLGQTF